MKKKDFETLVKIMAKLRHKHGCPWDRQQTHASLRQYLLEETYEVIETIDNEDYTELRNELGDLLLQIVFHSQIAQESGHFTIWDVIRSINEKLIRRHPHVFGEEKIETAEAQKINWEKIKQKEGRKSVLDGVPKSLSALLRAHRIQNKASHLGFDWENAEQVWEKVEEEIKEFLDAVEQKDQAKIESEFGDLLFSLVNYSRFIKVNPEDSLRLSVEKFMKRFKYIEKELANSGRTVDTATFSEMDEIWEKSKNFLP